MKSEHESRKQAIFKYDIVIIFLSMYLHAKYLPVCNRRLTSEETLFLPAYPIHTWRQFSERVAYRQTTDSVHSLEKFDFQGLQLRADGQESDKIAEASSHRIAKSLQATGLIGGQKR